MATGRIVVVGLDASRFTAVEFVLLSCLCARVRTSPLVAANSSLMCVMSTGKLEMVVVFDEKTDDVGAR
jgi:hypothetical protein